MEKYIKISKKILKQSIDILKEASICCGVAGYYHYGDDDIHEKAKKLWKFLQDNIDKETIE